MFIDGRHLVTSFPKNLTSYKMSTLDFFEAVGVHYIIPKSFALYATFYTGPPSAEGLTVVSRMN